MFTVSQKLVLRYAREPAPRPRARGTSCPRGRRARAGARSHSSSSTYTPRAHPLRQQRRLAEAGDRVVVVDVDDAERRAHLRDDDRRGRTARAVAFEQVAEVDAEQLVAVQREDRARLAAAARPRSEARRRGRAARARRRRRSPAPRPAELAPRTAPRSPARSATITRDTPASREPRDLVRGERPARDGDERLRPALRRVAEALGLAARQDQRLHLRRRFGLALGRLGQDVERRDGASDPLVREAGARARRRDRAGCARR